MSIWETIAAGAAQESSLWKSALRRAGERELVPIFSPLGEERFALAVETIYEGYLLHYGTSRLFAPPDADSAVLLGDYLYAHGLVRLAEHDDVAAVSDLAELISLCTQLRAEAATAAPPGSDGIAWAATTALLGVGNGRLEIARSALGLDHDPEQLERLALEAAPAPLVAQALAAHRLRVK